jgi:hypothetical protein
MRFTCPYCKHNDTLPKHHHEHFSENYVTWLQECYQWHIVFHYSLHFLVIIYSWCKQYMFIIMAIGDSFMGKSNNTHHSCNHNNTHGTHHCICHNNLRYIYKDIVLNGMFSSLHFTSLHFIICVLRNTYTDLGKTCTSWCVLTYWHV